MRRVSVVLQGPIQWQLSDRFGLPTTYCAIAKARALLPGCEIILSTWDGEKTDLMPADRIIYNRDPGSQPSPVPGGVPNNVNRQIVSTAAGLSAATHDLALKLRTDTILTGTDFLADFDAARPVDEAHRLFERPIVSNNLSSRNPSAFPEVPLPFHPADHVHFGTKRDLLTYWDVPLQTDEDASFFCRHPRPDGYREAETSRLTPEQHVCLAAFQKAFDVSLRHYADPAAVEVSERLLSNNFVFVPDALFSMYLAKYHTREHEKYEWMRYSTVERRSWRALTKKLRLA